MKKIFNLLLFFVLIVTLSGCINNNEGEVTFDLVGMNGLSYEVGDEYEELGYVARIGNKSSESVTITNDIDNTKAGDYTVTYTLEEGDIYEQITRDVYYREDGCFVVEDTTTTRCDISYTQYLNTYIKLTVYYDQDTYNGQVMDIFNTVEGYLSDYHQLSNKYDAFEGVVNVKTINDNPTEVHTIDERLFDLIAYSLEHQSDVDNLFNIALGPVLKVWHDYREACATVFQCEVPTLAELEAQDAYTNFNNITLDSENLTITMLENMSIDLGGVSKGYISEEITNYLDSLDLVGYLFNNGQSNISAGGIHPLRDHEHYILGVTDPERAPSYDYPGFITVMLNEGDQLVTSGDNQQYYEVGDDLYHHIINPNTLMPERYSRTVSVVVNGHAGLADIYSTAIFTMTVEDGLAFVNSIDGLEAVWYNMDGTITYSSNFEELYLGTQYKE